jgi:hypothetical protein
MTGIIAVPQSSRVHILTDGAVFDAKQNNAIGYFGNKVIFLPKHLAALVCLGSTNVASILQMMIERESETFDEMESKAQSLFPFATGLAHAQATLSGAQFEAIYVVAGISETHGPRILLVRPDAQSTVVVSAEPYFLRPVAATMRNFDPVTFDANSFNPETDGIAIMQAQRELTAPIGSSDTAISIVGGFIQHTMVTPHGLSTKIIHRWPDVKGQQVTTP